jgi:TRAP-type C4-dicarboxylate transport system substrate-binding protein
MRLLTTLTLAAALASTGAVAQTRWDLPAAYPANNFHTENLVQFASDVEKATDGKLKITVHANASLFKAPEIKRAVQGNQAQIGEVLISNYANENALFGVDVLPFVATSYDDAFKLYQASKPVLEKLLDSQGMKLLFAVPWPPQGLYSKKPLDGASDLKGMKFRAYNPATAKIADMFGAQPVTIQAAELSQAMATGAVESYISSGSTGYDTKTFEHLKYWYDTQAWLPKNVVMANKKALAELDEPTRKALLDAAAEAETRGWKISREKNDWYAEELKKHGMQVLPPSDKMKAEFKKVGDSMVDEWLSRTGAEGKAIIDAYNKM